MMWMKTCVVLLLSVSLAFGIFEGYDGYKKYIVSHPTEDVYKFFVELQNIEPDLDFWLLSRNESIILVAPSLQPILNAQLKNLGAPYTTSLINIDQGFSTSNSSEYCSDDDLCDLQRTTRQTGGFFRHFPSYSSILHYMNALSLRYPQYTRYEIIGQSLEGRIIAGLSISLTGRREKKLAYIQGGTHGREWIAPPTILYFAAELLANIRAFRRILQDTEIYIVPLVNPDGYEYTHTVDRFWRKNRRRFFGHSCSGVDINRNFGHYWNYRGSSQNLCSEVYSGTHPFSEPETHAVRRFLEKNRHRAKLVLDLHSFGKFIFYPYGFSRAPPPTRNLLHAIAYRAANQIAKYRGTIYSIGSSSDILYEASGGLDDYAYGSVGIPLSYTIELPGSGFDVPASEILHVAKETFAGFIEFIRHVGLF